MIMNPPAPPFLPIPHPMNPSRFRPSLLGAALLLPTPISLAILVLHFVFASIKASDEEIHLGGVFGAEYAGYMNRTGRFAPKLGSTP